MTVTAPDQTVWWDPAVVTADALDQLRLTDADVDAVRIGQLVPAAGAAANHYLDRRDPIVGPPGPPDLHTALVQVVVELYRRKDAPPVSAEGMFTGILRPGSGDPLAEARSLFRPYRQRQGLG